ncbi:MAG TPA: non-homologous end-joining DNA ligase [Methanothrix sp.]|nr:non-homologous end-joining DNA ligase [Methanothrix sp.]
MKIDPVKPMLAVSGQPFDSAEWIFEPKIDGTRCIAEVSQGAKGGKGVRLHNRRLFDITYRYPELALALAQGASGCVLDGEIAVFADGKPSFGALAERDHQSDRLAIDYLSRAMPASYVVFDILYAKERCVMDLPLRERKTILQEELQESEIVTIADSFPEKGGDYFQAALKMGIEGIMAKRLASVYEPGMRSQDWIKIKKSLKLDLVIGGYIPGKGGRAPYFGGLLMGAYSHGLLHYVGRVGSGFTDKELAEIAAALSPQDHSPFANAPATPEVRWVEPRMVVQVSALEITTDGHLRAPVFLRTRDDKDPQECTIDQLN